MAYRTVRGAITSENTKNDILENTKELLNLILNENEIQICDIISVLFTCTNDLDAVYPAVAAREIGLNDAGLFCMQEMFVEGSLNKCIRVMITFESELSQKEIKHLYLKNASKLRPDLTERIK